MRPNSNSGKLTPAERHVCEVPPSWMLRHLANWLYLKEETEFLLCSINWSSFAGHYVYVCSWQKCLFFSTRHLIFPSDFSVSILSSISLSPTHHKESFRPWIFSMLLTFQCKLNIFRNSSLQWVFRSTFYFQ